MECIQENMNIFIKFLKKTHLISIDFIYRIYFMPLFGFKIYYRHKISSFRSCAFCSHLSYDRTINKYVCAQGQYDACKSLVPCIIPESGLIQSTLFVAEDDGQVPWLFKKPCAQLEVLEGRNYFRNFLSFDLNRSIISLESLEGVLLGSCGGDLPCHLCACADKGVYTNCKYIQKAEESGKCSIIYDTLKEHFDQAPVSENSELFNVS